MRKIKNGYINIAKIDQLLKVLKWEKVNRIERLTNWLRGIKKKILEFRLVKKGNLFAFSLVVKCWNKIKTKKITNKIY